MNRSRPFTAFSPVALRLGVCALVAACVILPVTPPFAAGQASDKSDAPIGASESLVFIDGRAASSANTKVVRSGKSDKLALRVDAPCSVRHWENEDTCYLPATEAAPARFVRIVTLERREGNVSTLERRVVSSSQVK